MNPSASHVPEEIPNSAILLTCLNLLTKSHENNLSDMLKGKGTH